MNIDLSKQKHSKELVNRMLRLIYTFRRFEQEGVKLYRQALIRGYYHPYWQFHKEIFKFDVIPLRPLCLTTGRLLIRASLAEGDLSQMDHSSVAIGFNRRQ